MAELVFFSGTMDCGKSTLALQMDHNNSARGRDGVLFTRHDRAGSATISSRLGLTQRAHEVDDSTDFWSDVISRRTHGRPVDYLIGDEAQFYTAEQVEQLARVVDELDIDVHAFGITADFRTELFPGSRRLIELADRVQLLQVEALCWCGRKATHNARIVDGVMVVEGAQVVVGDTAGASAGLVEYEVLCRRHYMRRMNSHAGTGREPLDDLIPEVEVVADLDGRGRQPEAGGQDRLPHPVELGEDQALTAADGVVVVHLEGKGRLATVHRSREEDQFRHGGRA